MNSKPVVFALLPSYIIFKFIYLFLPELGQNCCARAFSNLGKWGPSLVVGRLLSEVKSLSHVQFFAPLWTGAYQASPSMVFSRQEY